MDFDPRDYDSRDDGRNSDRSARTDQDSASRERIGADARSPDRDRDDAHSLGRGPANNNPPARQRFREGQSDTRARVGDLDSRIRRHEPRDTFTRHLALPSGPEREIVRDRDREYTLRGSESRTLATVGAFRVVSSRDLVDQANRSGNPRSGDLRHLRDQGLVETVQVPGYRDHAVVLT